MNVAVLISTFAAAMAITLGLVALQMARGRDWSDQRWLAGAAFASAGYAMGNVVVASDLPPGFVLVVSRVQTASTFLAMYCWFELTRGLTHIRRGTTERWLQPALLVLAAMELVPGATYGGLMVDHAFPAWGVVYRDARPTPLGATLFFVANGTVLLVLVRALQAWRRGIRHSALLAASFATLFVTGVNDALSSMGLLDTPYLVDIGFLLPAGAVGLASTARFVGDAKALASLRDRLEEVVADRTEALSRTQWSLHQAEKLASLARFAVGVAGEVSRPASTTAAHLEALERSGGGRCPPEALAALVQARAAMQEIDALGRRLVEAGRRALAPETADGTGVHEVALRAVEEARAYCDERVSFGLQASLLTRVGMGAEPLHQVLSALLLDAIDSIPRGRGGRVQLRTGEAEGGLERITVSSDGEGTIADVLRHEESIFSTRRSVKGGGLWLAVAQALVERHGGRLQLERGADGGTLAVLQLPPPGAPV
jgi:signal transduction histidine kinase